MYVRKQQGRPQTNARAIFFCNGMCQDRDVDIDAIKSSDQEVKPRDQVEISVSESERRESYIHHKSFRI